MSEQVKAVISAAVILIVNVAALANIHVDQDTLLNGVMAIASLVCTCYGIWKNHNFTPEAVKAQVVLNELKAEKGGYDA